MVMDALERVIYLKSGEVATLTKARKQFDCHRCPLPIVPGEHYYAITIGGGGLQSAKFPERIHVFCLKKEGA
jgi:hypothetical protein